jgi:hypothetical protein
MVIVMVCVACPANYQALAQEPGQPGGEDTDVLRRKIDALEQQIGEITRESAARKALKPAKETTEEVEKRKAEDVLRASEEESTRYVLLKKRRLELNLGLGYSHSTFNKVVPDPLDVELETYYTFNNNVSVSYGLLNRLSLGVSVPFIYKYQKTGQSLSVTDIGDVGLDVSWQALTEGDYRPATTVTMGGTAGVGRSPYKIDTVNELSTGQGYNSASFGVNLSKIVDPLVVFGGASYTHPFQASGLCQNRTYGILRSVDPGFTVGYTLGIGYALSYSTSLSFRFSASHSARSEFEIDRGAGVYESFESDEDSNASFVIGTGWRITPTTTMSFALAYGLIGDENYSLSVSFPWEFTL